MNGELRGFRNGARHFIEAKLLPEQQRWRQQHGPDREAWSDAGRAGILLPDVPSHYGGGGGNFGREAVVLEELARAGVHFGSGIQSIVGHYILSYGTEEQRSQWLPRMARGELVAAIAMTELSAGSDLQAIQTTARRYGDCYVLNGSKMFVSNGRCASLLCVAVRTNSAPAGMRGLSLLAFETKNLTGYSAGHPLEKVGANAQDTCELFFQDVTVPASALLGGEEGKGFLQIMEQLPYERLSVGVSALAMAEQALVITTEYVKQRQVFGKPLIHHQNTRFKLAECKTEAHIGRVFLDSCIERFIDGHLDEASTAMAKYWLSEKQCRIVDECVQLHGGYGYLADHPIARMWVDGRAQRIYAGTNEIMKELIALTL